MKFVIHYHQTEPEHYDLMIERGKTLLTWQIAVEDINRLAAGEEVKAVRIQDHRKKYLTYEGPISCNRGMVSIYDSGDYKTESWDEKLIKIFVDGLKLKGNLSIGPQKDRTKEEVIIYKSFRSEL
ncbi:MAG: hypothetical protein GY754_03940 [bacterium]|nr:hypothetical protein [bacterium]